MGESRAENQAVIALLESKLSLLDNDSAPLSGTKAELRKRIVEELRWRKEKPVNEPLSQPGHQYAQGGGGTSMHTSGGYELRGPQDDKSYRSLFGSGGFEWPDREQNFFQAVFSGRAHPGLTTRAMGESAPSDGGFWVPTEVAERIHNVSLENEIVQPRAYVAPMQSVNLKLPAMSISDHSVALMGGFTASYVAEAGTITEHSPKARAMELIAKKLVGMLQFSSELNADTPGGMAQIENMCGRGLAWYRDKAFLRGTGAGEPLGILNAPCLVTVAKETGQIRDSILYENLIKMMSRMFAGSFNNSVWVAHQSTIPQLLSLSVPIGLSGQYVPVMTQAGGGFQILTRPVLFTEKVPVLGDKGDIMLCDFSQYVVGLRSEMRFDTSIHVQFSTDEILARLIERHDGQPLWDAALTLADGTTMVSPFVCLAERA